MMLLLLPLLLQLLLLQKQGGMSVVQVFNFTCGAKCVCVFVLTASTGQEMKNIRQRFCDGKTKNKKFKFALHRWTVNDAICTQNWLGTICSGHRIGPINIILIFCGYSEVVWSTLIHGATWRWIGAGGAARPAPSKNGPTLKPERTI
jgi:hypothetical protein